MERCQQPLLSSESQGNDGHVVGPGAAPPVLEPPHHLPHLRRLVHGDLLDGSGTTSRGEAGD